MRKCGNTWRYTRMNSIKVVTYKYTRKCTSMNRKKSTHEFTKGKLERHTGGLEGWSSERSAGDPRYRYATLIRKGENLHAPSSETWT